MISATLMAGRGLCSQCGTAGPVPREVQEACTQECPLPGYLAGRDFIRRGGWGGGGGQ